MDIMSEAIMEELLTEHNATPEEAKQVKVAVSKTGNPWDTAIFLHLLRIAKPRE